MKRKIALLVVLFSAFALFLSIKFFVFDRKSAQGAIKIQSSPISAVFIDNKNVGKTPYDDYLEEGGHTIKLIPDPGDTEIVKWESRVMISANTRTYVDRELGSSDTTSSGVILSIRKNNEIKGDFGEVQVESEPETSKVFLDNDEKGFTSVLIKNIEKGEHELSVYSPGFIRRTQKVNIETGFRINAEFKLAVDPTYQKVENEDTATESATTSDKEASPSATSAPSPTIKSSTKPSSQTATIQETPTGWLRVRSEPSINSSESARVNPGDKYDILDEKSGWLKIEYKKGEYGWISAQYTIRN